MADGRSTIDLFGNGFTLLRFGGSDVSALVGAAAKRRVPLTVVDVAEASIRKLYEKELVLVRPDGHVAWRSDESPVDAMRLIDRVRGASTTA
jgi:hypothetical protein